MPALRPLLRLLALLFALGQGIVPGAAAIADGELLAALWGIQGRAHVEPVGSDDAHRVHADECDLCRMLTMPGDAARAPVVRPPATVRARAAVPTAVARRAEARTPRLLPRGPPAA